MELPGLDLTDIKRPFIVGLLLIVACASSGDPSTTTVQPETTTSTSTVPSAVADGCVVGTWILDLDSFVASFEATLRATGRTAEVSANSGSATISLEENGQVAGVFEDLTVQTDFGEDSAPIDTILAGEIIGTWSVQENRLVLTPDVERTSFGAQTPIDISNVGTGNSGVVYLEEGPDTQVVSRSHPLPIASASPSIITCEGDTLTIGPERGRSATVWVRS